MSQVVEVMKPGEGQLLRQLLYLMSGVGAESQAKPDGRWLPTFAGKGLKRKVEDAASLCNYAMGEKSVDEMPGMNNN